MALSFFDDKNYLPSGSEVSSILGSIDDIWKDMKQYIEKYGMVKEEWKIYSKKAGWCKKILLVSGKEERNIIFLYPNAECITAVMVFGEQAVSVASNSELPDSILHSILSAKAYQEGRSFQIEIKSLQDYEVLKKLIDIKIKN